MVYWVLKVVLTPVFHLLWRVKVEGREEVPEQGPVVLAANHQSFCDSFFLPLVVPRRVTFLAKAEYFDSWKTAWLVRAVGQIPIRRGGGPESERALETAAEVLAAGDVLAVYPEGTRTVDDYVHKGRTGVSRLSRQCDVPIVPVGIIGTDAVQPVGSLLWHPFRTVTVRFGAPMQMAPGGPEGESSDGEHPSGRAFTDELMKTIAVLARRPYVDEYVPRRRS